MPIQVPVEQRGLEASIERAAKKAGKSLSVNLGKSARSIDTLSQPLGRITGKADEFTKSMEAANARVLAFGASVGVLGAVTKGFKDLVTTTIEVEKQLANINTILNKDAAGLNKFKKEIFNVARDTEQSFDTVSTAALELSRQGLKAEEVTKRLNDAMVLSRLSGLGASESVAGLTAAINSFKKEGLESSEILNKLSAAAVSAAVSERDLIEGIKRSASVANQAGVSFDELVGVITAVQQKTARGGAVIGNSFKTIFTRLQSFENLQALQDIGVQVTDLTGKVLPATKLIENLSSVIAGMDDSAGQDLATKLVGRFQIAPFLAILDDYASKTKVAIDITKVAAGATNEAYERNVALNKTLAAAINKATVNLKELADMLGNLGMKESLKDVLTFFNSLVGGIRNLLEGEGMGSDFARGLVKGISNVLTGPGLAIFAAVIGKLTLDLAKFGTKSLSTFFGMSKASKDIAATQGQIASSLLNNRGIQESILKIENSSLSAEQKKVQITKFFTIALNEQLAVMTKMQAIAARVAPGVVAGTRGRGRAEGYIPSFAGGYSAEVRDISMGVGGAPSNAKAVNIPNFNFGGGRVGPVVANDSEFIVPNFGGGGGSAIFNQDMAVNMGLPPNAQKINAAGGVMFRGRGGTGTEKNARYDDRFAMVVPGRVPPSRQFGMSGGKKYGFNVYGINSGNLKLKNDQQLIKDVKNFGLNLAASEAKTLTGGVPKSGKVEKLGNAGSVSSLAGTIFETAISALTKKAPEFKDMGKQTQTFDFYAREISGLRKLYPQLPPNTFAAEAKINAGLNQRNSMAQKMATAGVGQSTTGVLSKKLKKEFMGSGATGTGLLKDAQKSVPTLERVTGQKFRRGMARGYIPNFANGEPKYTRPSDGRQLSLKQALIGVGGDEIKADAQKHQANLNKDQANSSKKVTEANKKQARSSEGAAGKMMGVLLAASMLQGGMSETTSAFGRITGALSTALLHIAGTVLAFEALSGVGKAGGMVNKVFKKLSVVGGVVVGVFVAFKAAKKIINHFNGETDLAAINTAKLADAAATAAVALNKLGEVDKLALKEQAEQIMGEKEGKTDETTAAITTSIVRALASGVTQEQIKKIIDTEAPRKKITGIQGGAIQDILSNLSQVSGSKMQATIDQSLLGNNPFGPTNKIDSFALIQQLQNSQGLMSQLSTGGAGERKLVGNFAQTTRGVVGGEMFTRGVGPVAKLQHGLLKEGFNPKAIFNFIKDEALKQQDIAKQIKEADREDVDLSTARQVRAILERGVLDIQRRQAGLSEAGTTMARSKTFGSVGAFGINDATQLLNIEKSRKSTVVDIGKELAKINEIARAPALSTEHAVDAQKIISKLTFEELKSRDDIYYKVLQISTALFGQEQLESKFNEARRKTLTDDLDKIRLKKELESDVLNILEQQNFEIKIRGNIEEQFLAERKQTEDKLFSGELAFGAVRSANPFTRARGKFKEGEAGARMDALKKASKGDYGDIHALDLADELNGKLISASEAFATNIGNALVDAISKGQSLGDTLRQVAADFLNTMSKAFMNNAINNALNKGGGFLGGLLGFNTGGQVRGGSGARDDVPALLTGGEFVMNKKAVQNYGSGFMGALNSGSVPRYAKGGMFTPGTYGQGAISGSSNLLNFATQSYTGGLQDRFLSGSGLAGLALEPQSGRLTMSGRKNSPAFQREQESKRKAFELFSQQYSQNQQEKQKKEESKGSLLGALLGFGVSAIASGVMGGGLSSLFTKNKKATGGAVPYSAGIDSVPTMLSGGEFVMNAGAAQTLGAGNLAALNAGGGTGGGGGDAIVGKLDELNQTIASSNTEINITVNSDGTENTNSANAPDQQRGLAVKIKDVVRQVIEDEKRLGGSLRMA